MMGIVCGVRAFDIADLALIASINHMLRVRLGQVSYLTIILIHVLKQRGKRGAKVKAQAAAMTDVKHALQLFFQPHLIIIMGI